RLYSDASYYANLLGVKSSIISGNGAFIKDELNNKIISKNTLSKEELKYILKACEKFNMFPNIYTTDSIYIYSKIYTFIEKFLMIKRPKQFKTKILNVKNKGMWRDIIEENKDYIIKGLVFSFNKEKLKKFKNYVTDELGLEAHMSSKFTLEINSKDTNKGNGVSSLEKYYGIKREEIICIGDNENDIPMIEYAGLGVAMGNAKKEVKEKADFITYDNNNFGVANVINKHIFVK
ncbi:MAG: Cof-type HAD-IIB family hydrolase, partial [Clostridium perfringens]|nr:Cof-type HAD-IIB family hydrolase [Clostridium perfringens]